MRVGDEYLFLWLHAGVKIHVGWSQGIVGIVYSVMIIINVFSNFMFIFRGKCTSITIIRAAGGRG